MKLIITCILWVCTTSAFTQSCPVNLDFEAGNFTGWVCSTGSTSQSGGVNTITLTPSAPTPGRHEIITAASLPAMDRYGNFPRLCPYAGTYSVQLGNDNSNSEAEGLSYTFQIPALDDTFSLTYFYAVVFEDPSHETFEQPRFFVTAYDVLTGALIDCASYNYISTASIPGFRRSLVDPNVLYKDWTPASIDFSGLGGRTVRLEFKTADCTLSGHFGYAYVDVGNGCGGLISVAALCGSTNSVVLNAPYGFQSYTWYNASYGTVVGTQQNSTISPAPPPNTMFHVDMIPYPGFGCRDTANALVTALPVPDTPTAVRTYNYCQYATPTTLTATAANSNILLWYSTATGGTGSSEAPLPSTAVPGIFKYYVSQKKLLGCEGERIEITVNVLPTPVASFTINNDRQCLNTNNFTFSSTSSNLTPTSIYTWDFDDGTTSNIAAPTHTYTTYGIKYVTLKVENPPGCFTEERQQVNVVGAPAAQINIPPNICETQTPVSLSANTTVPGNSGTVNQWQWTIGTSVSNQQNPTVFYPSAGTIPVKLIVGTSEGCFSVVNQASMLVHYKPTVKFSLDVLCSNEAAHLKDISTLPPAASPDFINTWNWVIDNSINYSTNEQTLYLSPGTHNVKLICESNIGCRGIEADSTFTVLEKPHIQLSINDSCVNRTIVYSASSVGSNPVTKWFWDTGNGYTLGAQSLHRMFIKEGNHPVSLIGQTAGGCKDTIIRPFRIYQNHSYAGNDTIVAIGQPVFLFAGGGSTVNYSWSPALGLSDAHIENPVAVLDKDQLYELRSMSVYGCDGYSKILIQRFKGPELFIPSAFTPNGDGNNDVLRVFPVGMKSFLSFDVYNRFGVCLFHTSDWHQGWNGTFRGMKTDPGNYVVVARAHDYKGKLILKKLNVILIR